MADDKEIPVTVESTGISYNNTIEFKGKKVTEKKSKFHIMGNTNYRPGTNENAKSAATIIEEAAQTVLSDSDQIGRFVTLLDQAQWSPDVILNIDATHGVELGQHTKGRRIHVHIVLDITHYSKLRIDPKKFKEVFNEFLEGEVIKISYVHVTVEKNSMEQYVTKGTDFKISK